MKEWIDEMREVQKKRKWMYKCPLPKKRQRTQARAERPGKCRVYSEEEKLVYLLQTWEGGEL